MIFQTILSWVTGALGIVLGLLPNVDPAYIAQINGYTASFRSLLTGANWFFPVNTALLFLSIIFIIQLSLLLFKLIRYIAGVLTVGILK